MIPVWLLCLKTMGSILFGGSRSGFRRRLDDICTLSSFPVLTGPYLCAWGGFIIHIRCRSTILECLHVLLRPLPGTIIDLDTFLSTETLLTNKDHATSKVLCRSSQAI